MKTRNIRMVLIVAVIFFGTLIFGLSSQNARTSSGLSDHVMVWLGLIKWDDVIKESLKYRTYVGIVRQGAHFLLYAVSSLPVFLLIYTFIEKITWVFFLTLISMGGYAFLDEIHQIFVKGRSFQLIDMATDMIGVAFTSTALIIITHVTNVIYHEHSKKLS